MTTRGRPVAGQGDGVARQAMVLIHGIGEQRPMGTLRGFVDGLQLGTTWSKPDRISDNLELRRMSVYGPQRPPTDLYELYWAHHSPASGTREVLLWAARLLARPRAWRGSPVAPLLALVALLTSLALAAALAIALVTTWRSGVTSWLATPPFWVALAVGLLHPVVRGVLTRRIADAQRYLTPTPDNVTARNAIRTEGLTLLRRLHEAGVYQRVVVVGHSLGSVIGYDILRLFWDEARHPTAEAAGPQPEAAAFVLDWPDPLSVRPGAQVVFQQAQHRLWRECRRRGVPWLVTDFITLGSPLTHARALLDSPDASLTRRQDDLELPTCPPMPSLDPYEVDDDREVAFFPTTVQSPGREREILVGNHGALFGPTRWTNLYYPVRGLLGGDLVGGPLAEVFGSGIVDVPVHHSTPPGGRWRRWLPLHQHLLYWAPLREGHGAAGPRGGRTRTVEAVPALVRALALDLPDGAPAYPPPDPPTAPTEEHR